MASLPLFPLNTVLFPGMQVKLHIFEERYKVMINRCIESDEPFGVVLIRYGREALGPTATPYAVGCSASIGDVERLPLGRMNIVATGRRRFRIRAIDRSNPYLLGEVDYFTPAEDHPEVIRRHSRLLRPLLIKYLETLSSSSKASFDPSQLPNHPRTLAQIASILLQTDNKQKQELLAMDSLSGLLVSLVEIYQLETLLLALRLKPPEDEFDIGAFSSN